MYNYNVNILSYAKFSAICKKLGMGQRNGDYYTVEKYAKLIKEYSAKNYPEITKKPDGLLKYPFIVPGVTCYTTQLWDWDSWLTDIGINQIRLDNGADDESYLECEKGCVRNFAVSTAADGRMPIVISPNGTIPSLNTDKISNIHKPCFVQHTAFIVSRHGGDAEWLREHIGTAEKFLDFYFGNFYHKETGLFFWNDDSAIGVDNDPCTFYRPHRSSASVYLNCLMYKELKAMEYICERLGIDSARYSDAAEKLKSAVNEHMWDERNGFYYSVDLNLLPVDPDSQLHKGAPRHWNCLIQRIDVWSGFMAMWAGIADKDRAERMVRENMLNEKTFYAEFGVRTLSKLEKMYCIKESGNPSCWLGPVWGISNYMCFRALADYGYTDEARSLVEKTVRILGRSIEECGHMHEYYNPDTGEGVSNPGFQSWNFLVNNMLAWYEGREYVREF